MVLAKDKVTHCCPLTSGYHPSLQQLPSCMGWLLDQESTWRLVVEGQYWDIVDSETGRSLDTGSRAVMRHGSFVDSSDT